MTSELIGRTYELVGGGDDEAEHVADAVGLEEAVARVGGVPLQLAHREPLQPLQVLVRRPRRLQHRRRHRPPAGLHPPLLRHLLADAACHSSRAAERREGGSRAGQLGFWGISISRSRPRGRRRDEATREEGIRLCPCTRWAVGWSAAARVYGSGATGLWIGHVGLCASACYFMGQFLPGSVGV